jgi:hypothetical protein
MPTILLPHVQRENRYRLPTSLIHWIGTSGEDVESHLRMQLGDHPLAGRIIVRPHWYGYERR